MAALFVLGASIAVAASDGPATEKAREIEISFPSGNITLAGTLLLPAASAPVPAIVLLHGSGPSTRDDARPFAEQFVRDGMAALIFDKRGCGSSGGSWTEASLDDLAQDAIAASTFLRARSEIDAVHIGVWGVSQAGWVIPRAVSADPTAFAFAVIVTGGGLRPIEVERFDYSHALDEIDATPVERRRAMALVERYFEYLKTGKGHSRLESSIAAAGTQPWSNAINLGRVLPSEEARPKWQWIAVYDPRPDISRLKIPVLVVLGDKDRPSLSQIAEQNWLAGLREAANPDATVIVLIAGGHGITLGGHHPSAKSNIYARGYKDLVDSWLRAHSAPR